MYHFLSGYTAKVAGTEKGVTEPRSHLLHLLRRAVHAAPPVGIRQPAARADRRARVNCWLVNTGWTGGAYGEGQRMPIKATRALLTAALDGSSMAPSTAPMPISGSPCRSLSKASTAPFSIRARPGPTRRPMTLPPTGWSACSSRTSPSSKIMSTARCSTQRPASRLQRNRYETT
jgi:hypothetical protein